MTLLTVRKLLKKFGKNYDTIPESWLIFEVHRSAILSPRFELQDNGGMRPAMVDISRTSCETITMAMFLSRIPIAFRCCAKLDFSLLAVPLILARVWTMAIPRTIHRSKYKQVHSLPSLVFQLWRNLFKALWWHQLLQDLDREAPRHKVLPVIILVWI